MPQSPHHLRNDLKCVEWDVKPYYTIPSKPPLDLPGMNDYIDSTQLQNTNMSVA